MERKIVLTVRYSPDEAWEARRLARLLALGGYEVVMQEANGERGVLLIGIDGRYYTPEELVVAIRRLPRT